MNSDDSLVVIVMNQSDEAINYNLIIEGQETLLEIPAHAVQTLLIA